MKTNIIIPYRPIGVKEELHQDIDGRWNGNYGRGSLYKGEKDGLIATIKFLNKKSHFKHNIMVAIDNDVYPNATWLKEFDNVTIFKSPNKYIPNIRMNAIHVDAINNIPDEEWLCYAFIDDLICIKDWDKFIIDAIVKYGEDYVYVPMFVEPHLSPEENTPENIWKKWRETYRPALRASTPKKGYYMEEDIDEFVKIANSANKPIIIERPGDRIYGMWVAMFMKAKYAKKAIRITGGWDLDFDSRLYTECNILKVVITNCFVFHNTNYQDGRWC